MDIIYKIVSDWNLKTDFSLSEETNGIVSVAADNLFSPTLSSGSYSIADVSGTRHGAFSKSSVYTLHYFTYASSVLSLEKIEVDSQEIKGVCPRLGFKSGGDPVILYYDLNTLSISALEKTSGSWSRTAIDYVNIELPVANRTISTFNDDGKIYGAYIYSFDSEQSVLQYVYYDGSSWTSETIGQDEEGARFLSVAIVNNPFGNTFIFVGTEEGISVYEKVLGNWRFDRVQTSCPMVGEIDAAVGSSVDHIHVGYTSGTEVKYQRYDHSISRLLNRFLVKGKFIDFNASSMSIDVDSGGNPLMSYSHVEEDVPLQVFLKIARSDDGGDTFKTYNVDASSTASYVGCSSDIVFDLNDKICILYQHSGIKLYDEQKDIDEDNIESTSWRDRLLLNNLTASTNPPTRDAQNTYLDFDRSLEQCFYISDSDALYLDESTTAFSICFTIIPNGDITSSQTIISKSAEEAGYEIFLGGVAGLSLGVELHTIYGSLSTYVADLPAGEPSKVGVVYSGYDLKVYVKSPSDDAFNLYKYDIFGSVKKTENPFVIGAYGVKNESSGGYQYPTPSNDFTFSNHLDARLIGVKYWKRELSYSEASYSDSDIVSYDSSIDPYSDNIDYTTYKSSSGSRHFILHGEELGVVDYGGIDKINLLSYSNYDAEDRVTNSVGYSVDPFIMKKQLGGMFLLWSDKATGHSEIYGNNFNSNNATGLLTNVNSRIRCYGRDGIVVANSNTFVDPKASFFSDGVFVGDFLCFTSGNTYVGRRIPIVRVVSETCVEIGAYCSVTAKDLGYYIDSNSGHIGNDIPVKITDLNQTSLAPVAVSDSMNDIHIVYQSLLGDYYDLYYQRYRPANSVNQIWGSMRLTSKEGNAIHPSLAIDGDEVLHVVWEDDRNKSHCIMYGRSAPTSSNGEANFVNWSTSNLNGEDIRISGDLYAEEPHVTIDSDNVVHVVFAGRISATDEEKYEIYYCNNQTGSFTSPVRITSFVKKAMNPKIVVDGHMNRYIFFNCKQTISENIYMVKYDYSQEEWKAPRKISFSEAESVHPSACIDSDNIIYIYWIDRSASSDSIGFAKYNTVLDRVSEIEVRPSSSPSTIESLSVVLDETKTTYIAWEDSRFGSNVGTEIYKNELVNLVNFDAIVSETEEEKTDEEIIADQLNKFVIGRKYSDEISPSELPLSGEALGDVVLTLETEGVTYTVPVDIFNRENPLAPQETIILDSRDITVKIKGLPRTLAYRIKNLDDSSATYSEFYEFSIDEYPDTTVALWRLSSDNGAKRIGIQLYTLQGLVSPITIDLYLNEPDIYDILIFTDSGDSVGEAVSTEYQNVKVLSFNNYWVKIKPHRVVDDDQSVQFDVITQGNAVTDVDTTFDGEHYVGKFSVNVHDGVRYIDGNAKIVPKIVTE